jgi:trans-aconitate 2-methyltransferase
MENNISRFYDDYSVNQLKIGINDRIASLFYRLKSHGLNTNSRILELGCGIGVLSNIVLKKIKPAYLESVDLSPKSIELLLKHHNPNEKFKAFTADVVNYKPKGESFSIITLFDVIEHIPVEHHLSLFKNLSNIMDENTKLLINVPAPFYLKYIRENSPELLQIIDQEIHLNELIKNFTLNNLNIEFFETYSIWSKNDYQFIVIKKRKEYCKEDLVYPLSFFEKIRRKILRMYLKY